VNYGIGNEVSAKNAVRIVGLTFPALAFLVVQNCSGVFQDSHTFTTVVPYQLAIRSSAPRPCFVLDASGKTFDCIHDSCVNGSRVETEMESAIH